MKQTPIIAVVDDDEGVRSSLTSLLRSFGYEVRSYGTAADFLAACEIDTPACLISDIQMPLVTGDQLQAELIRAGHGFPIIFMTAFPTEATRQKVMAAGACAFLEKPVDVDAMARHLVAALGPAC